MSLLPPVITAAFVVKKGTLAREVPVDEAVRYLARLLVENGNDPEKAVVAFLRALDELKYCA